ncbi:GNAT family N-acetyltransferase [Clostridium sp. AL.422]|uniref:GNAT family N-acetyltransferase n=1 Tax=Clostridium TaxID=1485 RepID=UPI00293DD368|nr:MULTISPECIES: GNAT family N-acetyltransferase [unclassified Clostridium]MDV4152396.1 GNAT family N-acetyltransferase [Clostridium sp. AL.422]
MRNIKLQEMSLEDYNNYTDSAIKSYTEELLLSRRFKTLIEASKFAKLEYNDLFKEGFQTKDIFLYNIIIGEEKIGIIWFIKERCWGFIGDFLIYEQYRGNNYGYNTLFLLEDIAKKKGINELRLGVFRHNVKARRLYLKVGYKILKAGKKNFTMSKKLTK